MPSFKVLTGAQVDDRKFRRAVRINMVVVGATVGGFTAYGLVGFVSILSIKYGHCIMRSELSTSIILVIVHM